MILWADLETYSATPIKHGTYRYAEDSEIMLFAYAVDDEPAQVWDLTAGEPTPQRVADAWRQAQGEIVFHNAMFDRSVIRAQWPAWYYGAPLDRWRCTMVRALAHGLPGSLDTLCTLLGVPQEQAKLKEGGALVQLFCKPRPANSTLRRATRETHPAEWARFKEYARLDVEAMRQVAKRLPIWNYRDVELELWHLDQRINDRGVQMDVDLARSAIATVEREQKRLAARTVELTAGEVERTTQRDRLLAHLLAEYGVDLPDLRAATIERRVDDQNLPRELRELLAIRLQASSTASSKYKAVVRGVNSDGRMRGTIQFDGAARTGRAAGRVFQPQNLARLVFTAVVRWWDLPPKAITPHHVQRYLDLGIEGIKAGAADVLVDEVMALCTNAVRGVIVAAPGKKLVVSDLANIEGRFAAWLAGEAWKLQAFRDYDNGTGPDLYKLAYAKSFAVSPDSVFGDQRQIGKVMELMLQYEGGVAAFLTGAATYGIDLDAMAAAALPTIPADVLQESAEFWDWTARKRRSTYGLDRHVFIACDALKRLWRRAHPEITSYWKELADTTRQAINHPGVTLPCRRLRIRRDGHWLRIVLPSGRALCYPQPQVSDSGQISYMGMNQYSHKWTRLTTYGGKLFENVTQGGSRDVLFGPMPDVERAGYPIVLHVHDELITEPDDSPEYSAEGLSAILAAGLPWSKGLPLSAKGFEAPRYRKD